MLTTKRIHTTLHILAVNKKESKKKRRKERVKEEKKEVTDPSRWRGHHMNQEITYEHQDYHL